jgi:methionyl-tRNA formyltransferase
VLNVLFAGTPDFAAVCLRAVVESPHAVVGVLTQPDRRAGRGLAPKQSSVKRLATASNIQVAQPANLSDLGFLDRLLASRRPDIILVVAYGLMLPQSLLTASRYGAINVHASLLPRWRGAAPIQRALLAGDRVTGVSIMQMDAGLDTGPVLLQEGIPIAPADTTGLLHDRLAHLGASLAVRTLDELERGGLIAIPQGSEGVSYAAKIRKEETVLDWRQSAEMLFRQVRAFSPTPGARTRLRGIDIKILGCSTAAERGVPGIVLEVGPGGLLIGCGEGALRVTQLQRSGGRRLAIAEFLRGVPLFAGDRFESDQGAG